MRDYFLPLLVFPTGFQVGLGVLYQIMLSLDEVLSPLCTLHTSLKHFTYVEMNLFELLAVNEEFNQYVFFLNRQLLAWGQLITWGQLLITQGQPIAWSQLIASRGELCAH